MLAGAKNLDIADAAAEDAIEQRHRHAVVGE
jgi:hypothetical protein